MRIALDIDVRLREDDAITDISVEKGKKRTGMRVKRSKEGFKVRVYPLIHESEEEIAALLRVLNNHDSLMIGLGQMFESVFLAGIEIGKRQSA